MGVREQIQKAIDKKRAEIAEIDRQRLAAEHHIRGLEEALKAVPRDAATNGEVTLREGSAPALVREFLTLAKRPAHITELVAALGKEPSHDNRVSLASTLSTYARQGKVFVKTKPNTFGLIGMEEKSREEKASPEGEA